MPLHTKYITLLQTIDPSRKGLEAPMERAEKWGPKFKVGSIINLNKYTTYFRKKSPSLISWAIVEGLRASQGVNYSENQDFLAFFDKNYKKGQFNPPEQLYGHY